MEQGTSVEILLLASFLRNIILARWSPYSRYIPAGPLAPFPIPSCLEMSLRDMEEDVSARTASQGLEKALKAPCWCQLLPEQLELAGTGPGTSPLFAPTSTGCG